MKPVTSPRSHSEATRLKIQASVKATIAKKVEIKKRDEEVHLS